MVKDAVAEALENAGLYHRAARRWLEVFDRIASEPERDWIRNRRNACLRKKVRPAREEGSYKDIQRAAVETQMKMGIAPHFQRPLRKKQ